MLTLSEVIEMVKVGEVYLLKALKEYPALYKVTAIYFKGNPQKVKLVPTDRELFREMLEDKFRELIWDVVEKIPFHFLIFHDIDVDVSLSYEFVIDIEHLNKYFEKVGLVGDSNGKS